MGERRSDEEHFIEECAELIRELADAQFVVGKKKDGWEKDLREIRDRIIEEYGDVRKTIKRVLD